MSSGGRRRLWFTLQASKSTLSEERGCYPWVFEAVTLLRFRKGKKQIQYSDPLAFRLDTGAFGVALYNMRTPLRVGVLGVAVLVYVMAAHPTGAFALTVVLVAGVVLLLVELLARPPAEDVDDQAVSGGDDVTAAQPSGA